MASDQMPRVSVRLPVEQLDDIDALARYRDITGPESVSRSQILREFVAAGLDSSEDEVQTAHDALNEVASDDG